MLSRLSQYSRLFMIANPLYKIPCKAFQAFPLLFIGKAIIIANFFGLRFIPFTQFIRWANISERGIACYNGNPPVMS